MLGIGLQEITVVLIIIILIFGAAKIPEIAGALEKSVNSFKKGIKDTENDIKKQNKNCNQQ